MKHVMYACVLFAAFALILGCSERDNGLHTMGSMSTLSIYGVNGTAGEYCTPLYAGQTIDAGTVCAEVVDNGDTEELCITYTTTGGWELVEAHLWVGVALADMPQTRKGNPQVGLFPYQSGDITGQTTYTFCVDLTQFGGEVNLCDGELLVAAHAAVRKDNGDGTYQTETGWGNGDRMVERGNWATYFGVSFTCNNSVPPNYGSETAFAYNCEDAARTCFIGMDDGEGGTFNRWGWTNGPLAPGTYYFDIYAGAGQCDISKGTLVGLLTVEYDISGTVTVTYNTCGNYTMTETHLYVGENELQLNDGLPTLAPGQYPYIHEGLANVHQDQFVVDGGTCGIYVVAHAVVWGDFETDGDCGTRGCEPPVTCDPTEVTTLYGSIDGYLVTLDPSTGDATEAAMYDFGTTGVTAVSRLAFDATTGTLYGLAMRPVTNFPRKPALVSIDPCTGVVSLVGEITVSGSTVYFAEGFAINPDGDGYVSMSLNGAPESGDYYSEKLLTLNLATAEATVVGTITPTIQTDGDGLEFVGSTLYASDDPGSGPTNIYTLNTSNGAATFKGTLNSPRINNVGDFAWNPNTNVLYSFDPGAQSTQGRYLCTISQPGTAVATLIGITHTSAEFNGALMTGVTWASRCCE